MNKIILSGISLSLLLGASGAFAADPPPVPPHHYEFQKHERALPHHRRAPVPLEERLNLTDEQKEKAKAIREEGREKLKPIMKEMKELREKADKIRKENMKEFEDILTPEQKEILKSSRKDDFRRGVGPKGEKELPPPPPPIEE